MNCTIRKWRESDASALVGVLSDKCMTDYLRDGLPFPYTMEDANWYINNMLDSNEEDTFAYAITLDDVAIGSISVFRQSNIHRITGELGYYISKPYWGKGYTTDAVKQICAQVFENTDIIRIFAEVFADNIASCRVLEKAGFECEGTLRSSALKNGTVRDMKIYALLR